MASPNKKVSTMKKLMILVALALASLSSAALAGGKCWDCSGSGFASAGAGGFAGTAIGGDWGSDNFSNQDADALSYATPKYA